jgi:hypothetical protein
VANDGGDRFNYAIEMQDNGQQGDVEILFTRDLASGPVKALILAAKQRGVIVYPFCFNALDENTEADLAQMTGHIMGRMLNVTLLVDQGVISPASFRKQLRNDLALLRQKDATRRKLRIAYG